MATSHPSKDPKKPVHATSPHYYPNGWYGQVHPVTQNPHYYPHYYTPPNPWAFPISPYSLVYPSPTNFLKPNRALCINRMKLDDPDLVWNIVHYPDHARLKDRRVIKHYLKPDLDAPAVNPPVTKIWVVSDHPVLSHWMQNCWGHISVKAEEGKTVVVTDVLYAIYAYMRIKLTKQDMEHAKQTPGNEKKIRASGYDRIKESYEIDAIGREIGCVRADVVGHHRRFGGVHIVYHPTDPQQWRLVLSLLPGPTPIIP